MKRIKFCALVLSVVLLSAAAFSGCTYTKINDFKGTYYLNLIKTDSESANRDVFKSGSVTITGRDAAFDIKIKDGLTFSSDSKTYRIKDTDVNKTCSIARIRFDSNEDFTIELEKDNGNENSSVRFERGFLKASIVLSGESASGELGTKKYDAYFSKESNSGGTNNGGGQTDSKFSQIKAAYEGADYTVNPALSGAAAGISALYDVYEASCSLAGYEFCTVGKDLSGLNAEILMLISTKTESEAIDFVEDLGSGTFRRSGRNIVVALFYFNGSPNFTPFEAATK